MSEYIPIEIQEEILKRLPLKPLIQFRSVSKPWMRLIDSPDFIVSYGVRQPQPDRFILRYHKILDDNYIHRYIYDNYIDRYIYLHPPDIKYLSLVDNGDSFVPQEFIPTFPDLIRNYYDPDVVVGSSFGLLCFYIYGGTQMTVLWNPSLRKSVCIQDPYVYDETFRNYGVSNVIGFGVCPVTLDPIICKIFYISDYKRKMKDMPGISVPWKVRVFTLSTGTWSILSTNLPRESIRLRGSQVVIDRFIYWLAFDMLDAQDERSLIMSFDLTAKEFKEINLTGCLTTRLCSIKSISKLRESLVLLEFEEGVPDVCRLWMMKEQGVSTPFTKLYTINLDASKVTLLGFRKTGELVLLETQQQ